MSTATARGNDPADKLAPAGGAFLGAGSAASHHEDHSSGGSSIEEFAVLQLLLIPQLCYAPFQLDPVEILLLSGFLAAGILGSALGTCDSSLCCIEHLLLSWQ